MQGKWIMAARIARDALLRERPAFIVGFYEP